MPLQICFIFYLFLFGQCRLYFLWLISLLGSYLQSFLFFETGLGTTTLLGSIHVHLGCTRGSSTQDVFQGLNQGVGISSLFGLANGSWIIGRSSLKAVIISVQEGCWA